jgi:hypothetical protein
VVAALAAIVPLEPWEAPFIRNRCVDRSYVGTAASEGRCLTNFTWAVALLVQARRATRQPLEVVLTRLATAAVKWRGSECKISIGLTGRTRAGACACPFCMPECMPR